MANIHLRRVASCVIRNRNVRNSRLFCRCAHKSLHRHGWSFKPVKTSRTILTVCHQANDTASHLKRCLKGVTFIDLELCTLSKHQLLATCNGPTRRIGIRARCQDGIRTRHRNHAVLTRTILTAIRELQRTARDKDVTSKGAAIPNHFQRGFGISEGELQRACSCEGRITEGNLSISITRGAEGVLRCHLQGCTIGNGRVTRVSVRTREGCRPGGNIQGSITRKHRSDRDVALECHGIGKCIITRNLNLAAILFQRYSRKRTGVSSMVCPILCLTAGSHQEDSASNCNCATIR